MILPCARYELSYLNESEIIRAIIERRWILRGVRDARLDDRCWLDDYLVWAMVEGSPSVPRLTAEEGMERCRKFYHYRRADAPDPVPADAILDPAHWDDDLSYKTYGQLLDELTRIQEAIFRHMNVEKIEKRSRTVDDDRALYSVLPEKVPADFRLPPEEEFLGRAKQNAGCPNFWSSHAGCGRSCNIHQWGPCVV